VLKFEKLRISRELHQCYCARHALMTIYENYMMHGHFHYIGVELQYKLSETRSSIRNIQIKYCIYKNEVYRMLWCMKSNMLSY